MKIGYACLTLGVNRTKFKTCTLKKATDDNLTKIILNNLEVLENILEYNIKHNIKLFRITSDLIPFGSSLINKIPWAELFFEKFTKIGEKINKSGMRVSMHPGQYTVLNSPHEDVVKRAVEDLNYHTKVLDCLNLNSGHKIILHIGGVYQDKASAIQRFALNYQKLRSNIKRRLVIENDDKSYNITDVLKLGTSLGIPVVFDNLHHQINPSLIDKNEIDWIDECRKTWQKEDGRQKIHYSQQNRNKKAGSHSESIKIDEFIKFYKCLENRNIDIMLEVKNKNLSAIKCLNSTNPNCRLSDLDEEWRKYKYLVLEHSPKLYLEIRALLRNKDICKAIEFYKFIESALENTITVNDAVNAAQHIWGYFKKSATENEKKDFLKILDKYLNCNVSLNTVKNKLWRLTNKYKQDYLLNSYYFLEQIH